MKRKTHQFIIELIYPSVDFILVAFAIMAAYKFYRVLGIGQHVYYQKIDIIPLSFLASLLTIIILLIFDAYKRESSILNMEEIESVVKGLTLSFLLITLILVIGKYNPSRYVLFFSYIFSVAFVVTEKVIFYHILPLPYLKGFNKKILIYGAGELGQALFRSIANSPKLGIVPVGFVDDDASKTDMVCQSSGFSRSSYCISVLGTGKEAFQIIKQLNVDEVYVAIANIQTNALKEILDSFKAQNIKTSFVPNLYKLFVHKVHIQTIGQIPIVWEEEETTGYIYSRIKRSFDICMALICLLLFFPIIAIIALAIKIDSKGPVIFRHKRVGIDGKLFDIFKFRSMTAETDSYSINPTDQSDTRITKVGRFLRKTSLDELPQLINVLKGDMSLVGPRPEMPFIVEQYNEIHKERLKVLPGITGLWQLSGDREKAIHENMDYDLYYIRNKSLFLDIAILIETLIFAFKGI